MAVYTGRYREFKAIYEHLKTAEKIMKSLNCYKSDYVDYKELAQKVERIAEDFDKRAQKSEEPWRQVWDKFIYEWANHTRRREPFLRLIGKYEKIIFFKKEEFNTIVDTYFDHNFIKAYTAMDSYVLKELADERVYGYFGLCLDTMEIQNYSPYTSYIRDRKKFSISLINDPEAMKELGWYKEKTVERFKKLIKIDEDKNQ